MKRFMRNVMVVISCVIASVAMAATASAADVEATYTDMANHWANEYVEVVTDLGVFDGFEDGSFRPEETLTVEQGSAVFHSASKFFAYGQIAMGENNGNWASPMMNGMIDAGIMDADILNRSVSGMTRYEIAGIAARYLGYENDTTASYVDSIDPAYEGYVGHLQNAGIMVGFEDGCFGGNDTLTRAEAATIVYRMLAAEGVIADDDTIEVPNDNDDSDSGSYPRPEPTPDPDPTPDPEPTPDPDDDVIIIEDEMNNDGNNANAGIVVDGSDDTITIPSVDEDLSDDVIIIEDDNSNEDGTSSVIIEDNNDNDTVTGVIVEVETDTNDQIATGIVESDSSTTVESVVDTVITDDVITVVEF